MKDNESDESDEDEGQGLAPRVRSLIPRQMNGTQLSVYNDLATLYNTCTYTTPLTSISDRQFRRSGSRIGTLSFAQTNAIIAPLSEGAAFPSCLRPCRLLATGIGHNKNTIPNALRNASFRKESLTSSILYLIVHFTPFVGIYATAA